MPNNGCSWPARSRSLHGNRLNLPKQLWHPDQPRHARGEQGPEVVPVPTSPRGKITPAYLADNDGCIVLLKLSCCLGVLRLQLLREQTTTADDRTTVLPGMGLAMQQAGALPGSVRTMERRTRPASAAGVQGSTEGRRESTELPKAVKPRDRFHVTPKKACSCVLTNERCRGLGAPVQREPSSRYRPSSSV